MRGRATIIILIAAIISIAKASTFQDGAVVEPPPEHPTSNFTVNFLKGLTLDKISSNYAQCVRSIDATVFAVLDLYYSYHSNGIAGLTDSVTIVVSNLYYLNTTCRTAGRELAYALSRYMIEFKDDSYLLAVLREIPLKIDRWVIYSVNFKSCMYAKWWGCAGFAAGRFASIVLYATPKKSLSDLVEPLQLGDDEPIINSFSAGETIRTILNTTLNAFDTSGLLTMHSAPKQCKAITDEFYPNFLKVVDLLLDSRNWNGAAYQLLYTFRVLHDMYIGCGSVLHESMKTMEAFLSTLSNPMDLIMHLVFRSKSLMAIGVLMADEFKAERYENFGYQLGYFISGVLLP